MRLEYGDFRYVCDTCHHPVITNAKRIGQGNNCLMCAINGGLVEA